jgi:hypothetical protein
MMFQAADREKRKKILITKFLGKKRKTLKIIKHCYRGRLVIREFLLFREGVGAGSLTTRKATDDCITVASKSIHLQNTR